MIVDNDLSQNVSHMDKDADGSVQLSEVLSFFGETSGEICYERLHEPIQQERTHFLRTLAEHPPPPRELL